MVDQVGDIVRYKREGRVGVITKIHRRNRVSVTFHDTTAPQTVKFKKKDLESVVERRDLKSDLNPAARKFLK